MADKQALNATFFAFRKRERGGVLFGATIAYILISIVLVGAFVALNWAAVGDYFAWTMTMSQQTATDPNNPFGGMMPPPSVMALSGWYFLFMIFFYLLLASYEAACLRWMIRGETKGFMGLALDGDTWRVYFTYWIWFFLLIAFYFVIVIVMVGAVAGAATGARSGADAFTAMAPAALLIGLVVLLGLIYFAVRLAPAAATSIAKRRFAFFDAWTVTKGRFWALLGAFVLLWLMYIVGILILSVGAGVATGAGMLGQAEMGAEAQTPDQVFAMFSSPAVLIPVAICYGVMIIGAFVFYVALFGVNARAAQAALEEGKITAAA